MLEQGLFASRDEEKKEDDPPAATKTRKTKRTRVAEKPKRSAVKRATTIGVRSCYASRIIVSNAPSGTRYVWEKAGAVVEVKIEDLNLVMSKNSDGKAGCCGSGGGRTYFELAE